VSWSSRLGQIARHVLCLKQLAQAAGHSLDLTHIPAKRWIETSISSHSADYRPMAAAIATALQPAQ